MLIKRKLLIEYRKLLVKNIILDNKLKRRQIMANTIDIWKFHELRKQVENEINNADKPKDNIHI